MYWEDIIVKLYIFLIFVGLHKKTFASKDNVLKEID